MPFRIQRVANALSQILSISSGDGPRELADQIVGHLDLLQFYGLTQRQALTTSNAAAAEGTAVVVTPSSRFWTILFAAQFTFTKTATMTAARAEVFLNRTAGSSMLLAGETCGPFGATETGSVTVGRFLDYPLLLPPGSTVFGQLSILGTDATAATNCSAEFGVLG